MQVLKTNKILLIKFWTFQSHAGIKVDTLIVFSKIMITKQHILVDYPIRISTIITKPRVLNNFSLPINKLYPKNFDRANNSRMYYSV